MNSYLKNLRTAQEQLDLTVVQELYHLIRNAYHNGNTIFLCGNGGSAALASHMAIDLTKYSPNRIKAISLTDNVAAITAIANDFDYDFIFSYQLAEICEAGDLLIAISASGASMNMILAAEMCKQRGGLTAALTGNAGDAKKRPLHTIADHAIIIESSIYGVVEDVHCSVMHTICQQLKEDR